MINAEFNYKNNELIIHDQNSYLSENITGYAKDKYRYSDTMSVVILHKDDKVYSYLSEHASNKITKVKLNDDGLYNMYYIVIPNQKWIDNVPESIKNKYDVIYYYDGENVCKISNGVIVTVNPVELEGNISNSTIKKETYEFISTNLLWNCYINLCYQIFNDRGMSSCWNKNKIDSELVYKRDLVWMALNVINYLSDIGQTNEIQRILKQINGCNGLCKSNTSSPASSGCGCSK